MNYDSIGDYISTGRAPLPPMVPSVLVSVGKIENGYTVILSTNPKPPKIQRVRSAPSPFAGQDPDELIDRMVDGFGALVRAINDKGAGEDWKDEDNRKQLREAFRIMFPGVSHQIDQMVSDEPSPVYEESRREQLVFESKEKLLEYLTKNL